MYIESQIEWCKVKLPKTDKRCFVTLQFPSDLIDASENVAIVATRYSNRWPIVE